MPNHVHLLLTPATPEGLSRAVGGAHRRCTAFVDARARVTGHLFQGRFASAAMDDAHWPNGERSLAFDPVRAGLAARAEDWAWSSVRAHLASRDDALVTVKPLLAQVRNPRGLFTMSPDEAAALPDLETKSMTGRPLGDAAFPGAIDASLGRTVTRRKPGRKSRAGKARQS